MQKSVVFGTVFMDCQGFAAYRYDPIGRNVGSVKFFHGGVGRNAAENLASLGADVLFVSSVDDSALGREILDKLTRNGVDVSHVRPSRSAGMGLWLAIMDQNGNLASSISQMPDVSTLDAIVREEG
ncbi:MAG: sugar kinase, partial [Synergistes sp.]|nr:sugar kinase [Synergistes sp.]